MNPPGRLRFGVFEVDPRSGELLRSGVKVPLQDQPARALLLLLERPGDLVTREQLIGHLWPAGTFVDFDRGLNKIVAKLRVALDDDADRPSFIETVPQRGYRFLAAIDAAPAKATQPSSPAGVRPSIDSLAVLPLDNLSGDPSQEYFSDGMTEELIAALAVAVPLRVISRTSAMVFKGARKPLPVIARELGADAIVEGSVARAGGKVRIIVQLIHAPEDRHLWSGRYERQIEDILRLQAEVAASIAGELHKFLGSAPGKVISHRPRVQPAAYEAYLKGNLFRQKLNPADLEKSIGFFNTAIGLDPSFAPTYESLARSHLFVGIFGLRHPLEVFRHVRSNAVRALELDPGLPLAHVALAGWSVFERWDWEGAEAECRLAVEANPSEPFSHAALADYLSIQGRHSEAVEGMGKALELDPLSPEFNNWLALIYYRARRYPESIARCERALEIDPHHANVFWFQAWSLEQCGETARAIEILENGVRISGGPHHRAQLGRMYGNAGEAAKARAILEDLVALSKRMYLSPVDLAMIHLGLDDRDSMFESLEEAWRQRVWRTIELTMPMFDRVRDDERWWSLVRRVGLERSLTTGTRTGAPQGAV